MVFLTQYRRERASWLGYFTLKRASAGEGPGEWRIEGHQTTSSLMTTNGTAGTKTMARRCTWTTSLTVRAQPTITNISGRCCFFLTKVPLRIPRWPNCTLTPPSPRGIASLPEEVQRTFTRMHDLDRRSQGAAWFPCIGVKAC